MTVTLRQPLTLAECQQYRKWRNAMHPKRWTRTGEISEAQQTRFYHRTIQPTRWRMAYWWPNHQYYAIEMDGVFVGVGGLTYLRWRLSEAEISLMLGPEHRGQGLGEQAVDALIAKGARMERAVTGECLSTGNLLFWTAQIRRRPAQLKWKWPL